jgi:hypothetical protein
VPAERCGDRSLLQKLEAAAIAATASKTVGEPIHQALPNNKTVLSRFAARPPGPGTHG